MGQEDVAMSPLFNHPEGPEELDAFHHHEIVDRAHVIICMIEDHLINHPACDDQMRQLFRDAIDNLAEAYQIAARK